MHNLLNSRLSGERILQNVVRIPALSLFHSGPQVRQEGHRNFTFGQHILPRACNRTTGRIEFFNLSIIKAPSLPNVDTGLRCMSQ